MWGKLHRNTVFLNNRARSGARIIQKCEREGAKSAKADAKNTKKITGLLFFLRVLIRDHRVFALAWILPRCRRIAHGSLGGDRMKGHILGRAVAIEK